MGATAPRVEKSALRVRSGKTCRLTRRQRPRTAPGARPGEWHRHLLKAGNPGSVIPPRETVVEIVPVEASLIAEVCVAQLPLYQRILRWIELA